MKIFVMNIPCTIYKYYQYHKYIGIAIFRVNYTRLENTLSGKEAYMCNITLHSNIIK